ncbi:FAD-binding oxidoreductase [Cognatishimia sp. SS12]|nr:FAD-binding oxidoreductase [Cognatishimia sp. SS12]
MQTADVAIIGGGAVGLACARSLKQRDPSLSVLVIDKGDFASGGSGRNGSAFRTLWSRDFNILLSKESLDVFRNAEEEFSYPRGIDFKEDGYLLVATDQSMLTKLESSSATLERLGVKSELLSADETRDRCRHLAPENIHGGLFGPECGTLSPFRYLDALLTSCRDLGVQVDYLRNVLKIEPSGQGFVLDTATEQVNAAKVIVCTDFDAPDLLEPIGIDLPVTKQRKAAMVTEPTQVILNTSIGFPADGLFVKQLERGNLILTLTTEMANTASDVTAPGWLHACASKAVEKLPFLADAAVLRCWTGLISKTPDMQAVMGETDCPNLYVAVSAYKGIMLSPAMGRVMSEIVLTGTTNHPSKVLAPSRFRTGKLEGELLTI